MDENGIGNSNGIKINTNNLSLINNAALTATTEGQGDSGLIRIQATERIILDGSFINSRVDENGIGNSNGIEIDTNTLSLTNGASINALTEGQGNAGGIAINSNTLSLTNHASINAFTEGQGNAGGIAINSNTLFLTNAFLNSNTNGDGSAGNITINALDSIVVDESSFILAQVLEAGLDSAGDIEIMTGALEVTGDSRILATTEGRGNAGNVKINVADQLILEKSNIQTQVFQNGEGDAGDIEITADSLDIAGDSRILATTQGRGNAGNISLNISDRIILDGNNAPLRPSNIEPFDDQILNDLEGRTGILADATNESTGNGGNIKINTNFIIAFPNGNSDIVANASSGSGGNITINAESLLGYK